MGAHKGSIRGRVAFMGESADAQRGCAVLSWRASAQLQLSPEQRSPWIYPGWGCSGPSVIPAAPVHHVLLHLRASGRVYVNVISCNTFH